MTPIAAAILSAVFYAATRDLTRLAYKDDDPLLAILGFGCCLAFLAFAIAAVVIR